MTDTQNEINLLLRESQSNRLNAGNRQTEILTNTTRSDIFTGSIGLETAAEGVSAIFDKAVQDKGAIGKEYVFPEDLYNGAGSNGSRVEFFVIGATNNAKTIGAAALYMPPNVISKYTGQWNDEPLRDITAAVNETMTEFNRVASGLGQLMSSVLSGAAIPESAYNVGNQLTGGRSTRDASTRTLVNPHKALLYQGHNFRGLDLTFDLFARNKEESNTILKIIKLFKIHSHPGSTGGGRTWTYPDEFIIQFVTAGTNRSEYMFKFGPCILEDVTVTYGPNQASFFSGTGAPVHVNLQLTFKEVFQLTKEFIDRGW